MNPGNGAHTARQIACPAVTPQAAIACGNPGTAAAAAAILRGGGNAVDAAVGAGFAAAIAEPGLTSLGGGGFLLLRQPDGEQHLLDFFVNAPGRGLARAQLAPHFTPVTIAFSGTEQIFHAGYGSVAVPGALDGYLLAHRRFGRLPLADVLEPARAMAEDGTPLARVQGTVLQLLFDILTLTQEARDVFAPSGTLPAVGDLLRNEHFGQFLRQLGTTDTTGWRDAPGSEQLVASMTSHRGLVTSADLSSYEVVERTPLTMSFGGVRLTTNPAPSFGGSIISDALHTLMNDGFPQHPTTRSVQMVRALRDATERAKDSRRAQSAKGTTHLSVVDGDGAFVSMTTSNGSCSGVMAQGTGVQLNNVMGEADLHPDGFHATEPGTRIGSMMAPMLLDLPDGSVVALGSGGSERIRSALLQVIMNLAMDGNGLAGAIVAPRIHFDGVAIQVEPGLPAHTLAALAGELPVNSWSTPDLYFGGVHAVRRSADGVLTAMGDPRRDGVGLVVEL